MRRRTSSIILAFAVVAASALTGWGAVPTTQAAAAGSPTVTVITPPGGIKTGQPVTVSWTGFPPGPANLYQCFALLPGRTAIDSCRWETLVPATTDANGNGTAQFPVWFALQRPNYNTANCTGSNCVVRVSPCVTDVRDEITASAPLTDVAIGEVIATEFDETVVEPDAYTPQQPTVEPIVLPTPLLGPEADANPIKTTVFGAGSTGVDLAMQGWAATSLSRADMRIDISYAAKSVDTGYEAVVKGQNAFSVAGIPLIPELIFPEPPEA